MEGARGKDVDTLCQESARRRVMQSNAQEQVLREYGKRTAKNRVLRLMSAIAKLSCPTKGLKYTRNSWERFKALSTFTGVADGIAVPFETYMKIMSPSSDEDRSIALLLFEELSTSPLNNGVGVGDTAR